MTTASESYCTAGISRSARAPAIGAMCLREADGKQRDTAGSIGRREGVYARAVRQWSFLLGSRGARRRAHTCTRAREPSVVQGAANTRPPRENLRSGRIAGYAPLRLAQKPPGQVVKNYCQKISDAWLGKHAVKEASVPQAKSAISYQSFRCVESVILVRQFG